MTLEQAAEYLNQYQFKVHEKDRKEFAEAVIAVRNSLMKLSFLKSATMEEIHDTEMDLYQNELVQQEVWERQKKGAPVTDCLSPVFTEAMLKGRLTAFRRVYGFLIIKDPPTFGKGGYEDK